MYELIITGGSPVGMTAAVYAARKKLNTWLISHDIGGQKLLLKLTAISRGSANKYIKKED